MDTGSRIAVFGLGYVGCVTAACLAKLGHRVTGVDRDQFKVQCIQERRAPFYEPGLAEIIQDMVSQRRLNAVASPGKLLAEVEIALICVGTPSEKNGDLNLEQVRRVCQEISEHLVSRDRPLIIALRSTVFPGSCENVVIPLFRGHPAVSVLCHPEFLREGNAVRDFLEPSLVVIGGEDAGARQRLADLYAPLAIKPCLVGLRTAEMIKYACNAFHALKVSFANEIASLCLRLGISGDEVMETLCRDHTLNISNAYLKPGFAFGGSCLPKDLRALVYRASRLDLELPLLESVLPSNQEHLNRAVEAVLDLPAAKIGFFGLAFKENTDDLRESPVVLLLERLIGKGRDVRVFDPNINLKDIYGSNQRFLLSVIPHIEKLIDSSFDSTVEWADYLVITQIPRREYLEKIRQRGCPVLNLAGGKL